MRLSSTSDLNRLPHLHVNHRNRWTPSLPPWWWRGIRSVDHQTIAEEDINLVHISNHHHHPSIHPLAIDDDPVCTSGQNETLDGQCVCFAHQHRPGERKMYSINILWGNYPVSSSKRKQKERILSPEEYFMAPIINGRRKEIGRETLNGHLIELTLKRTKNSP